MGCVFMFVEKNMRFVYKYIMTLCLFGLSFKALSAQEIVIRGRVCHANTYQEISQVNIYIKETNIGTTSDIHGTFTLRIPTPNREWILVFEHIAYFAIQIPLIEAQNRSRFDLQPRVIQLPEISVVAEKGASEILKDIPQSHSIISAESFEIRGYVDVADLLKTEQSIQVDEELSGKKTVGIRGGNPDDVVVLYNGVRMNNLYDNVFDLSLINLEDVSQLEIIRGSNTALYGADANSGVINIVPKTHSQFSTRVQQKIGTYALGTWDVHFNRNFYDRLNLSYTYKEGGTQRLYSDSVDVDNYLKNMKTYHTGSMVYSLSGRDKGLAEENLSLMYLNSKLEYENLQFNENLLNRNQMISMQFDGHIGWRRNVKLRGSYQWLDEERISSVENWQIDRHVLNKALNFGVEKRFIMQQLEFLAGYQYEGSELNFQDERRVPGEESLGIESALLSRKKHGVVGIAKIHVPTESSFYKATDFDVSFRYDHLTDTYNNIEQRVSDNPFQQAEDIHLDDKSWGQSMLKFSSHLFGSSEKLKLNVYLNYGTNYKFPTMFQQISSPSVLSHEGQALQPYLKPEKNNSTEIGVELMGESIEDPSVNGWQLNVNYFRNAYNNKLRMFYIPFSPIAYYDNIQNAEITGFELKAALFMIRKKLTLEFGTSNYSITEKAAFPFKAEHKHIVNVLIEHAAFSVQIHGFKESDQVGWIRKSDGTFTEVRLKGYTNVDFHISKTIVLDNTEFFVNFSGRNLLGDETRLEGLTLRDRRVYFTFGIQF